MMLDAVILAGGLGTRMQPLTDLRPKPSLLVVGIPLVGHQLRWLSQAGVHDALIATSYRADVLHAALGDGSEFGAAVSYLHEPAPLGTGGALALATRTMNPDDVVVVLNGDQLTGHDLEAQLLFFAHTGASVTIHARRVNDARAFGLLELDGDQVRGFCEKPAEPTPGVVNAGTYILRAGVLHDVPSDTVVSLEREVFPRLIADGSVVTAYLEDAYCLDVGSPRALLQANRDAVARTGANARIEGMVASSATVDGHSFVGRGAVVGAEAVVHGSVLMPGCVAADGTKIERSIVAQTAVVAEGVRLQYNVIGEGARVSSSLEPGAVVPTGAVIG